MPHASASAGLMQLTTAHKSRWPTPNGMAPPQGASRFSGVNVTGPSRPESNNGQVDASSGR